VYLLVEFPDIINEVHSQNHVMVRNVHCFSVCRVSVKTNLDFILLQ